MIITRDFVMLNYPKSGSTFSRAVIKTIFARREQKRSQIIRQWRKFWGISDFEEFLVPNTWLKGNNTTTSQHGGYSHIPKKHRNKHIFTVVRNPVVRFASIYSFRFWEVYPGVPEEVLLSKYPRFPELTPEEYFDLHIDTMLYSRLKSLDDSLQLGPQTVQFIQMFFKEPERVLAGINEAYLASDDFLEDLAPITFLKQENLRTALFEMLVKLQRFAPEELEVIFEIPDLNVTKSYEMGTTLNLSEPLKQKILYRERFLLRILNKLGIAYDFETANAG